MSRRKHILLASPYSRSKLEKALALRGYVFGQPKLNGERAIWTGQVLLSSEGNEFISVPHITAYLQNKFPGKPLDGELYKHGWPRQQIHSVVSRTRNLHPEHREIRFHVFDIVSPDTQDVRLAKLFDKATDIREPLILTKTYKFRCHDDAEELVTRFYSDGYEGLIVRKPNGIYKPLSRAHMMKWKPKRGDTYEVVDYIEGIGKYAGTLGALIVRGSEGRTFHVGSFAVDDRERDRLWRSALAGGLIGKRVRIRYFELTEDGIPPSSVFEAIVD